MKVEELRAALEAVGASTEGNKPTLVERLVAAQRGDAMDEDDDAAPEPPKEAAEAEEPQQVTPEETPAEAPAPAPKPQEEDSDDDFAPKKNPWDEENPTPEATGEVLDPYILLKRDFPGRDDDLRQLGVEPTIARENKPFKLKKKPMSATTPEHVTMVPRTDGSSSLLNAPWVANRALGHGAFGAVFDVTLKGKDAQRCALKICFNGGRERRFGIEREIEVLAEVSRRRPAKPAPAPAPAAEAPAPAPDPTSLPPLTEDARSLIERAAPSRSRPRTRRRARPRLDSTPTRARRLRRSSWRREAPRPTSNMIFPEATRASWTEGLPSSTPKLEVYDRPRHHR